jgi:CubicO group peptidase (beta-lactamase class C family)
MSLAADLNGTAMVTRAGSVEVELAQGHADIEAGTECSAQTRFQLCSVSKQFAAAAAMLLVESGQLDLNEPAERWLTDGISSRITLHHLLSHTAGLPHWLEAPGLDPAEPVTSGERLAAIAQAPLRTEPGTEWHYSSPGFLLVGLIVARASGQPYPEFLAERILAPLKLTSTTIGGAPATLAARGYRDGRPVTPFDLDAMAGTGDIWSTAGDLTRFVTALHTGALLTDDSLRAMRTPHAPLHDEDAGEPSMITTGYGYGLFTGTFGGHPTYYHPGDNPGFRSFAAWIPDRAASLVVLANDENPGIETLVRPLLSVALEPSPD